MKKLNVLSLGWVITLGLSMTTFAQAGQIIFTDTNGPQFTIPAIWGEEAVGIVTGTLNGTLTNFVCDDTYHSIGSTSPAGPDMWNVNGYTLAPPPAPDSVATYGQYGVSAVNPPSGGDGIITPTPTIQQDYNMVAYLANLILSGGYKTQGPVGAIQWAIWTVMNDPAGQGIPDPGGAGCSMAFTAAGPTDTSCGAAWVAFVGADAEGTPNQTIVNSIVFLTPEGVITSGPHAGAVAQELITETPEPLSMALMGTFLTFAGLGLGRKKLFS